MADPVASLAAVWRTLRSMRTALILLLVVALASIAGSLVPQATNSARAVESLVRDHPLLARFYQAVGLFDVYGSWWFTLAYVLLLISLASCLVPRTRALIRAIRKPPQPARELETLRHFAEGTVDVTPEEAVDRARSFLRKRRYRLANGASSLAAEKGASREAGSLLFHASVFLIVLGVILGKGFGFTGQATLVEGETFTESPAAYDQPPTRGRFFSDEMHQGFQLRIRSFDVSYRESGLPRDFVTALEVIEDGSVVRREEIRVNHPLEHRGVKFFQQGYGWAPVIRVRAEGRTVWDGPVVFLGDQEDPRSLPWRGVLKLPSLRPQVGLELRLFPDPVAALSGAPMLEARDPFLAFTAFRGDLRLTRAQNVFELDRRGLGRSDDGGIGVGQTASLAGLEVTFEGLREYTQLRVARDPGKGLVLAGALLLLAGLLPALASSRRKVWFRAIPDPAGARVQVGGLALQRRAAFEEEFRRLARELAGVGTLPGPP